MGVSFAIAALVHARRGHAVEARSEGKHALFLLSMLATVAPWISIEARIFLARTFLLLGDVGLARVLTHEATELLVLIPDGEVLEAKLAALEQLTEAEHDAPWCTGHTDDARRDACPPVPADASHLRRHRG